MLGKTEITIDDFKTRLANLIAEAIRAGVDRAQIRAALVEKDDAMKDIFKGQRRYERPQAPPERKRSPLVRAILGINN
jgi:hypothetical protein